MRWHVSQPLLPASCHRILTARVVPIDVGVIFAVAPRFQTFAHKDVVGFDRVDADQDDDENRDEGAGRAMVSRAARGWSLCPIERGEEDVEEDHGELVDLGGVR